MYVVIVVYAAMMHPIIQDTHKHTDMWYDVTSNTHTFIRVKACEGVHVVLATEAGACENRLAIRSRATLCKVS